MTGPQVILTVPGNNGPARMDAAPSAGEPHTIHLGGQERIVGSVELGFIAGQPVRIEASRDYLERLESAIRVEIASLDAQFGWDARAAT